MDITDAIAQASISIEREVQREQGTSQYHSLIVFRAGEILRFETGLHAELEDVLRDALALVSVATLAATHCSRLVL